jgi:mono/diheme cytochrome c family protein
VLYIVFYNDEIQLGKYSWGMRMRIFMNTGLLLMVVILSTPEVLANPPLAYEGRRIYVSYCMLCHGPEGKGDGPLAKVMEIKPTDLSTTVRSRSDTILTKIITGEGR